jgi:hypothetical protein
MRCSPKIPHFVLSCLYICPMDIFFLIDCNFIMLLVWKYSLVQMIAHFVQIMCVRISTIKYHFSLTWTKHGWHGECLFLFCWNFKQFFLWKYKSKLFVSVSVQFFGKKIYMWATLTKIPRFVLIWQNMWPQSTFLVSYWIKL